jgi:membrane-associated protease RseP (regulator of RpoE activity)
VVLFILALIVMLVFHESGHFLTAKLFGMKVEQFFLGFGPRLTSWRRGETEYGVRAIPAGAFVVVAGMNPQETVPESEIPRTYGAKPAWQRTIFLLAGSASHFVLAFLIMTFSFAVVGVPGASTTTLASIEATLPGGGRSPAAAAGLKPGDVILSADGTSVASWDQLQHYIQSRAGSRVALAVRRSGRTQVIDVTPVPVANPAKGGALTGFIGVAPQPEQVRQSLPVAVWSGIRSVGSLTALNVAGLAQLVTPGGFHHLTSSVGSTRDGKGAQAIGIVGAARLAGQAAQARQTQDLLQLLAIIIIVIGLINLLPLPPLDGGHLLVLVLEKVRGRPIDKRKVAEVAFVVVGILAVLTVGFVYLDIFKPIANPFK